MDDYDIVHGIMAMMATLDVIWDKSNEDPDDYWKKITIVNIAEHNECNYLAGRTWSSSIAGLFWRKTQTSMTSTTMSYTTSSMQNPS